MLGRGTSDSQDGQVIYHDLELIPPVDLGDAVSGDAVAGQPAGTIQPHNKVKASPSCCIDGLERLDVGMIIVVVRDQDEVDVDMVE